LRFTKVKIDLPIIFDEDLKKEVVEALADAGFKKTQYIVQDEETILLYPNSYALEKKDRYYVRYCQKFADIEIKTGLNEDELKEIYGIYVESAAKHKYKPKAIEVFRKLNEKTVTALARNKESKKLEGFLFGYVYEAFCARPPVVGTPTGGSRSTKNVLGIMYAGMTDYGRDISIGYGLYWNLIEAAFNVHEVDIIDMIGASRTKNRDYTSFKMKFSKEFTALPGSFEKLMI
jgi:hypothetical protein